MSRLKAEQEQEYEHAEIPKGHQGQRPWVTWWRQSSQFGQICGKGQAPPHPLSRLSRGERVAAGRVRGQLPTEPHSLAV
jgi:hypothetical protein